jgi:hypothetical protein
VNTKWVGIVLILLVSAGVACAQSVNRSYYVRADGDDENNNGRSEEAPYKTLAKAVEMVSKGAVKTITVIGRIDGSVSIENSGTSEILITGKADADENEKAVLSNTQSRVLVVSGDSKIRLENIEISNSASGLGVTGTNAVATLGNGSQIKDCKGTGVSVGRGGTAIMEANAIIMGCKGGGAYVEGGALTMKNDALVTNNSADIGGGIEIGPYGYARDQIPGFLTMLDNSKVAHNTAKLGGGIFSCGTVILQNNSIVSDNLADDGGGILRVYGDLTIKDNALIQNNTANMNGGGVFAGATKLGSRVYSAKTDTVFSFQGQAKITGNTAKNGGGIYASGGKLSVTGGEISKNKAEYGGGVFTDKFSNSFSQGYADVSASGGVISDNEAEFVGGGVYVSTGSSFQQSGSVAITRNVAGDGEGENLFKQE